MIITAGSPEPWREILANLCVEQVHELVGGQVWPGLVKCRNLAQGARYLTGQPLDFDRQPLFGQTPVGNPWVAVFLYGKLLNPVQLMIKVLAVMNERCYDKRRQRPFGLGY